MQGLIRSFALGRQEQMARSYQSSMVSLLALLAACPLASPAYSPPRTMIMKDIKMPDPIPEAGVEEATRLMLSGRIYRYNVANAEESVVSQCEREIGEYTGHDYVVALNSCGSALFLSLKCVGVQPGDKVLTNAFTFTAVPSAIEHAQAVPVYVESEEGFRLDTADLERKMLESGAKFLMISHMRGKVAHMDRVLELCNRHGVVLLEDCAHSIGVKWNHKHTGHHGVVAAISSQSYKMLNSGEGGFLLTNDPSIAAKAAVYAGAYEELRKKHIMVPGEQAFGDLPRKLPNYSLRMHAVTAAMIRPQIGTIDARAEQYNARYYKMSKFLNSLRHVQVPEQYPEVSIVGDSLQFTLVDATDDQVQAVIRACKERNLNVELFGHASNARNFRNWLFAPANCELPQTERIIKRTLDVRMPLLWDDEDFDTMGDVIKEAIEEVFPL